MSSILNSHSISWRWDKSLKKFGELKSGYKKLNLLMHLSNKL